MCLFLNNNLSNYFQHCAMGRRKKANKPPPKRKIIEKLDSVFNCPFCNHEKSCEVKMFVLYVSCSHWSISIML